MVSLPPTPTPWMVPPGATAMPSIDFPTDMGNWWGLADDAIQGWHLAGTVTSVLQLGVLTIVVVFAIWVVYRLIRSVQTSDSQP